MVHIMRCIIGVEPTRRMLKWGGAFPFFKVSKLIDEIANIDEVFAFYFMF